MTDEATLAFYAARAADYVRDNPGQPDQPGARLLAFLDALAPAACVLELGSGSGRDAGLTLALSSPLPLGLPIKGEVKRSGSD